MTSETPLPIETQPTAWLKLNDHQFDAGEDPEHFEVALVDFGVDLDLAAAALSEMEIPCE